MKTRRKKPSPAMEPQADGLVDSQPTGRTLLDDVVTDILARVDAALREGDETDAALAQVEREVRRDWGGERAYIAKSGEDAAREKSQRDDRIRSDYRRGEHLRLLARRYGLSVRRIKQIVSGTGRAA